MKSLRVVGFAATALALAGLLAVGVYNLSRGILGPGESKQTVNCTDSSATSAEHIVIISGGKLSTYNLNTKLCDTLTIVNSDDQLRLMAFGVHEKHQTYSGVTEETLKPGERMTVTLERAGTFTFHDHLHDEVKGTFTVH